MKPKDIMFSVNDYDKDGDLVSTGVYLHFGEIRVKAAESIEEFSEIISHIESMVEEIETNY